MAALETFVLIFLGILKISTAQNSLCGSVTQLAAGQVSTISWPETNNNSTWCGYVFKAPVDYHLVATLTLSMWGTEPSCSSQYVAVSLDNMDNWEGYTRYCGVKNAFPIYSIGNELKIGISANDFTQRIQIKVQAVKTSQSDCDCSWTPSTRIIGGQNAGANTFTSHVTFSSTDSNFCGGTLITQYHAITAGHCVANINSVYGISNVVMNVGRYNIRQTVANDLAYSAVYSLYSAVAHYSYNNPQNANDIGIVTTRNYVRFTRGVSPACIPFSYQQFALPEGTTLVAVGFGSTQFARDENYDQASWTLQRVNLQVDSTLASDCGGTVICAKGYATTDGRGDTCTRDSGGGLYMYLQTSTRYYATAVISRGFDCGSLTAYSYNMYVVSYIPWIKSMIGTSFLCNR